MPEPVKSGGRIAGLDGLRGILALLVLFHHVLITQPDFANFEWSLGVAPAHNAFEWAMFHTPLELSWVGQERALVFFVLSGYVLSLPWVKKRPPGYFHFMINRFCRIYLPYIAAMALASLGALTIGGHPIATASVWFNQLGWAFPLKWHAVPSIVLLLNNGSSDWVNESIWSLVWEVRVAIIFPLLMLPVMRWRNAGLFGVLITLVLAQAAVPVLAPAHLATKFGNVADAFFYPQFFLLGVAVALNQSWIRAKLAGRKQALIAFFFGLVLCWVHWPLENNLIDGIGGAVIISAIIGSVSVARWFEAKLLIWLGRISYSLYLVHVPLLLAMVEIFHGRVPVLVCVLAVPLCICIGALFHYLVERPGADFAHRLFAFTLPPPRSKVAATTESVEPA